MTTAGVAASVPDLRSDAQLQLPYQRPKLVRFRVSAAVEVQ